MTTISEPHQAVKLGDVMQRVAMKIYSELTDVIDLMRNQDPELRTVELLAFISRSRKQISQLLVLNRWLSTPAASQSIKSSEIFKQQYSHINDTVARNLDEVYFAHAGMYIQRSQALSVLRAKDLLARGTYSALPRSIFSCGKPAFPAVIDSRQVLSDLDIYIRAKLLLKERSMQSTSMIGVRRSLRNGVLYLWQPHLFMLALTLVLLREQSDWNVLGCRLLATRSIDSSSEDENTIEYDVAPLEVHLLEVLRRIAAMERSRSNSNSSKSSCDGRDGGDTGFKKANPSLEIADTELSTSSGVDVDVGSQAVARDAVGNSNDPLHPAGEAMDIDMHPEQPAPGGMAQMVENGGTLERLVTACRYAAVGIALRQLYAQSLDHIASAPFGREIVSNFVEKADSSVDQKTKRASSGTAAAPRELYDAEEEDPDCFLSLKFWHSKFSR